MTNQIAIYTVALGYDGAQIATISAETPLEAAMRAHEIYLRDSKRDPDGWTYEEHGYMWGAAAARRGGSGNGAENVDDCLFVYLGEYDDDHTFDTMDRSADDLRAIVRPTARRDL